MQSLEIARKIGDEKGEGISLGNLGNLYRLVGKKEDAAEMLEQRLQIARKTGDRRGEGSTLTNLGQVYLEFGETERPINFFEQNAFKLQMLGRGSIR